MSVSKSRYEKVRKIGEARKLDRRSSVEGVIIFQSEPKIRFKSDSKEHVLHLVDELMLVLGNVDAKTTAGPAGRQEGTTAKFGRTKRDDSQIWSVFASYSRVRSRVSPVGPSSIHTKQKVNGWIGSFVKKGDDEIRSIGSILTDNLSGSPCINR